MHSPVPHGDAWDGPDSAGGLGRGDVARHAIADYRSTLLWWALQMVFLPFGIPLLVELSHSRATPARLIVSLLGAALFVALYAWTTWQNARTLASPAPPEPLSAPALWWPIGVLGLGAWLLTGLNGPVWGSLFIFAAAAACARLPLRQAVIMLGVIALAIVIGGARLRMAPGDLVEALVTLGVTGAATCSVVQAVRVAQRARVQREELARHAAVTEERLRIARDLHDLLGHTLSVIALKSELARRLVSVDGERAEVEIADVERVARQALQEVREAVAGYRQPTLASELASARELLDAAGIRFQVRFHVAGDEHTHLPGRALPGDVDSALGSVVREGVTNILRHSSASTCSLQLTYDDCRVRLEMVNDGVRQQSPPAAADGALVAPIGNGLRGLEERARSLGGSLDAGHPAPGTFRLSVHIPLGKAMVSNRGVQPIGDDGARGGEGNRAASEPRGQLHSEPQ